MKRLLLKLRETLGQLPDTQGRKIFIDLAENSVPPNPLDYNPIVPSTIAIEMK